MTYTATHRLTICALLVVSLVSIEFAVANTTAFGQHPLPLSIAILFDCTVLTTAIFYSLVARPLRLPISRTVLFALAAVRLALFILPVTPPSLTVIWPVLLAFLEGTVVLISVLRFRQIRQTYITLRVTHDAQQALHGAFSAVFGEKVAHIILSEGQVIYHALFNWRASISVPTGAIPVTTHRESGQLALLIGLMGIGLIETTALHFLLAAWWPTVAWWATAVSLYGCLLVLAIISTTLKRPSYRTQTALYLRLDMRWQAVILLDNIASVTPIFNKPDKHPHLLNAALITAPNVLIILHEPIRVTGIYGLSRTVTQLSLFADGGMNSLLFL